MDEAFDGCTFWDPDFYKKTTKRIEDGYKLSGELIAMLEERADIEKAYAKSLQNWSKKWQEIVTKGAEQGDMRRGWLALLQEGNSLGDIHLGVRQGLEEYIIENIKLWSKDSYHKSIVTVKEKKDSDDLFKRIQKPWTNQIAKVKKAKLMYYEACRSERKAKKFKENGTLALSDEQLLKVDERIQKAQDESLKLREHYMRSIEELDDMSPRYVEEMKNAFNRCQNKEAHRLKFFTESFVKIHKTLNISANQNLPKIYEKYISCIQNLDHDKDLLWWSTYFGDKMPFTPPKFEEFIEIVEPQKKGNSLLRQVLKSDNSVYKSTTMPTNKDISMFSNFSGTLRDNIFKGKKAIRVRALYDYVSNAYDELSLKEGDEFDKLEDEDELGWSKGLKDGKIGLYPANYVRVVNPVKQT